VLENGEKNDEKPFVPLFKRDEGGEKRRNRKANKWRNSFLVFNFAFASMEFE
jgi:hypothetical protein